MGLPIGEDMTPLKRITKKDILVLEISSAGKKILSQENCNSAQSPEQQTS